MSLLPNGQLSGGGQQLPILIYDTNNFVRIAMSENPHVNDITDLWAEILQKATMGYVQIFAADGFNSRKKRKEIYPGYKAQRKTPDQSIYDGINFFKELLKDAPPTVLYCEMAETEADDIIACLANYLPKPVHIISTDKDFIQLRKIEGVTTLATSNIPPRWMRLYKTLVGDPSDNIKGIAGFGEKSWEALDDSIKLVTEKFLRDPSDIDKFNIMINQWRFSVKPKQYLSFMEALSNHTLLDYWEIIGFMPLKYEELPIKSGTGELNKAQEMFAKLFMQGF